MRLCSRCNQWKPREAFHKRAASFDGLQPACKECRVPLTRAWVIASRERRRALRLLEFYGITAEEFAAKWQAQNHRCAICEKTVLKWVVDHDHATGDVRGLLCDNCNMALGKLGDSPERLRAAADYVQQWRTKRLRVVNQ